MIRLVQDPLSGDWVSLSAARQGRPFTAGASDACPFCPGPLAEVGTEPFQVAVFDNRYPVFDGPGTAAVVVYSPHHDDDLGWMEADHAEVVWRAWQHQSAELAKRPDVESVFIFENRGRRVGATISHPHGQIYGYPFVPPRLALELPRFAAACPLCGPASPEPIVLHRTRFWTVQVPQAMRMPYQVRLVPNRHRSHLEDLSVREGAEGSRLLQAVLRTYDVWFGHRTALVMALYQGPVHGEARRQYHLRWDFLPIERGDGKRKYIAGSELAMGAFVTDVLPEHVYSCLYPLFRREVERNATP